MTAGRIGPVTAAALISSWGDAFADPSGDELPSTAFFPPPQSLISKLVTCAFISIIAHPSLVVHTLFSSEIKTASFLFFHLFFQGPISSVMFTQERDDKSY